MITVVLSWGWMGFTSFLLGFAAMEGIGKATGTEGWRSPESYILAGLLCLTVYAQLYSLFGGVGGGATLLLGGVCLLILALLRGRILSWLLFLRGEIRKRYLLCVLMLFLALLLIYITAGRTWHYDTDLYHAQTIRWIEDYGAVKGLGNLHNRFAYNSAFFCLQALFSLKFILNQSMHSLNGFIALVMLCYGLGTLSIWKKEGLKISDFYKIGLFLYFGYGENALLISSPGSDILTLCMVLYLSAKWAELAERQEKNPAEYGILCLLAVWTVTVKVSAGLLVFLTVYPAVLLVRQKKRKQIFLFLGTGLFIVLPFLIRNVIVSGYLLYPYSSIDLFDVDWKMAASVAADDSREIMAWARGMTGRAMYDAGFSVWFPKWFGELQGAVRWLFLANLVCLVPAAGYLTGILLKKKRDCCAEGLLLLVSVGQVVLWFVTAPLVRYGLVFLLLIPAFLLGLLWRKVKFSAVGWAVCAAGVCCGAFSLFRIADIFTEPNWKRAADYNWAEARAVSWENTVIYLPEGDDCIGYHFFPSTPNEPRLKAIEMRSEDLKDGFRLKEEYRGVKLDSGGVPAE